MDYPPFADAVARFRSFLNEERFHGAICWVFPSDVVLVGRCWVLRPRSQERVIAEVAAAYERAVDRRLGVKFGVLCKVLENLWCYIFCPTDRVEAEYCLMPDGLKLGIGMPPDEGRIIVDVHAWDALRAKEQSESKLWRFT